MLRTSVVSLDDNIHKFLALLLTESHARVKMKHFLWGLTTIITKIS